MQILFTFLITLQFVVVISHDLVDIPGWTHGAQVRSLVGPRKLWLITLVNGLFPGLAAGLAIYFWKRPTPALVEDYWVVYCAVTLASAIAMIMGFVQLIIVAAVLGLRNLFYRGPVSGGKG